MQVTDEMVDAGLRITLSSVGLPAGECLHATDVREILIASLSDKQAVEVKIKPLEWKDVDGDIVALARTSFDIYFIERDPEGFVLKLGSIGLLPHQTFEAAKAAAQTDYEQRIRSAIVDVPLAKTADVIADLEEVRKAVFGDVGDEPDVYADYDRLSELSGKMRRAIAALSREGEDSAEVFRSALQRISELTPARANAKDARDLHLTVKAIADAAIAATRNASAINASGTSHD